MKENSIPYYKIGKLIKINYKCKKSKNIQDD